MVRIALHPPPRPGQQSDDESSENNAGGDTSFPIRPKKDNEANLAIYPVPQYDGLIARISPPKEPKQPGLTHVPCDIALVIDVSGSMGLDAPVPTNPGEAVEKTGLSVLDLVKHAARTILETLNEGDRLGIVTFASQAKVLQELLPVTAENKKTTLKNIESMQPNDVTNLWQGILEGINLFSKASDHDTGRVPAVMILTDGLPNHMNPQQGFVPKLRTKGPLPAALHTFGFGYSLKSGLLKSIAEIGGGNYAFIPDAGMIGTVFVHAVANLQSTFANHAVLRLTYPNTVQLQQTTGHGVDVLDWVQLGEEDNNRRQLTIALGNIQYSQARDIYLRYSEKPTAFDPEQQREAADTIASPVPDPLLISAVLEYRQMTPTVLRAAAHHRLAAATTTEPSSLLPEDEAAYQVSRSLLCDFIAQLFPIPRPDGEHEATDYTNEMQTSVATFLRRLPASRYPHHPGCAAIMADIGGAAPAGQVSLALSRADYWNRWGIHYLPSLQGAHARQLCHSFKDPGPLLYGADSPLFIACRDRLDDVFDRLPAPIPSNPLPDRRHHHHHHHHGRGGRAASSSSSSSSSKPQPSSPVRMGRYHRRDNPCFAGFCQVLLADGTSTVRVGRLRRGMAVATPRGPRRVAAVLKTRVRRADMVRVGPGPGASASAALVVTPWHPVLRPGRSRWEMPAAIATAAGKVRYTGSIYSVLLQEDGDARAHAIMIGGLWGVTLGHGVLKGPDVRAHQFLGNYRLVCRSLAALEGAAGRSGVVLSGGVRRDSVTGRVCGFKKAQGAGRHRRSDGRTTDLILRKTTRR